MLLKVAFEDAKMTMVGGWVHRIDDGSRVTPCHSKTMAKHMVRQRCLLAHSVCLVHTTGYVQPAEAVLQSLVSCLDSPALALLQVSAPAAHAGARLLSALSAGGNVKRGCQLHTHAIL